MKEGEEREKSTPKRNKKKCYLTQRERRINTVSKWERGLKDPPSERRRRYLVDPASSHMLSV